MDIGSPRGKEKSKSSSSRSLLNGLDDNLGQFLHIQDSNEQNTSEGDDISGIKQGVEDLKLDKTEPDKDGLCKYNSFPSPGIIVPSAATSSGEEDEGEKPETALEKMFSDESVHSPSSTSISSTTPLKLVSAMKGKAPLMPVSAMKGSREKQGAPPRKLTVKWAPDVYDPPPTIVSHTVNRNKKHQKRKEEKNNKQKNGKKGQKGNFYRSSSSGGGSGKNKKQFRKMGGCYKAMDASDREPEFSGDLNGLDVGGPDIYCGSSFLKESLTKVHYSVAEAL